MGANCFGILSTLSINLRGLEEKKEKESELLKEEEGGLHSQGGG